MPNNIDELQQWMQDNTKLIEQVGVIKTREMLAALNAPPENRVAYYESVFSKMPWHDRFRIMTLSIEDLKNASNENLQWAALFQLASNIAVKLLPIAMALL